MRLLLSVLLLASPVAPALASIWNAPDSTRPAPWGGAARAPQVLIPWAPPFGGPSSGGPFSGGPSSGGPSSIDPITDEQATTWTDLSGGEGTGGYSGGGDSSSSSGDSSSSSSDSSSACGGNDSSSNSCGPSGSGF